MKLEERKPSKFLMKNLKNNNQPCVYMCDCVYKPVGEDEVWARQTIVLFECLTGVKVQTSKTNTSLVLVRQFKIVLPRFKEADKSRVCKTIKIVLQIQKKTH